MKTATVVSDSASWSPMLSFGQM